MCPRCNIWNICFGRVALGQVDSIVVSLPEHTVACRRLYRPEAFPEGKLVLGPGLELCHKAAVQHTAKCQPGLLGQGPPLCQRFRPGRVHPGKRRQAQPHRRRQKNTILSCSFHRLLLLEAEIEEGIKGSVHQIRRAHQQQSNERNGLQHRKDRASGNLFIQPPGPGIATEGV